MSHHEDTEGHMPLKRGATEQPDDQGMEPDEAAKGKFATEPAPDEPDADEAEGHMPLKRGASEPAPDDPGIEPDEARFRATEPAPDDPLSDDTEGHERA